jgi:hypothetical protein
MFDPPIRDLEEIREDCASKLHAVDISGILAALLGCLLGEDWTVPSIAELRITSDRDLMARFEGPIDDEHFLGTERELIHNIHRVAQLAKLDGDEMGYLLGRVAEIKVMA